jgi:hypothetical protein
MPIRINLLAEIQALEEIRRRDPVKRAIFVAIAIVVIILFWITSLMVKKIASNGELAGLEQKIQSSSKDYSQVLENQKNLVEDHQKIAALSQLSTNRFLVGNVLDALQKSTVANVQLTRFKIDQSYALTEAIKPGTNSDTGSVSPGKPATIIERTTLTLLARDNSTIPGDSIVRFQSALSHNPFLHSLISSRTNDFRLITSLTPQSDPDGKTFVAFTLEAHLPDKTR